MNQKHSLANEHEDADADEERKTQQIGNGVQSKSK